MNLSNTKTENLLLLAVENQVNDFMYTDSAKDKEKFSPKKLNVFKYDISLKENYYLLVTDL